MTISLILYVVAIILMVASSIGLKSKIDLFKLGWAFAVAAFAFAGTVV